MENLTPIFDPENPVSPIIEEEFVESEKVEIDGTVHILQGGGAIMRDADGEPQYLYPLTWCGAERIIPKEEYKERIKQTFLPCTCDQCYRIVKKRKESDLHNDFRDCL